MSNQIRATIVEHVVKHRLMLRESRVIYAISDDDSSILKQVKTNLPAKVTRYFIYAIPTQLIVTFCDMWTMGSYFHARTRKRHH